MLDIQRCDAFAVISIDRIGNIRQEPAATLEAAMMLAGQYAATRISVTVEDAAGDIVWETEG
jgi:DNA gyrase inhibitor GyrI